MKLDKRFVSSALAVAIAMSCGVARAGDHCRAQQCIDPNGEPIPCAQSIPSDWSMRAPAPGGAGLGYVGSSGNADLLEFGFALGSDWHPVAAASSGGSSPPPPPPPDPVCAGTIKVNSPSEEGGQNPLQCTSSGPHVRTLDDGNGAGPDPEDPLTCSEPSSYQAFVSLQIALSSLVPRQELTFNALASGFDAPQILPGYSTDLGQFQLLGAPQPLRLVLSKSYDGSMTLGLHGWGYQSDLVLPAGVFTTVSLSWGLQDDNQRGIRLMVSNGGPNFEATYPLGYSIGVLGLHFGAMNFVPIPGAGPLRLEMIDFSLTPQVSGN